MRLNRRAASAAMALLTLGLVAATPQKTDSQMFLDELATEPATSASEAAPLEDTENPHIVLYGATVRNSKWPTPSIFVCWEQDGGDVSAKSWVRDAVERTWEAHSGLRFKGWMTCARSNAGIRIAIEDSGPHVKTLGRRLDRMENGMVLNFTFENWSQSCAGPKREACIRSIAVHEFGHAIGFVHEQNRPDAPGECQALRQATDPDVLLTPYDPKSVMNYCNDAWNNDGQLSTLDIEAVRILYGKRASS